MGTFRCRSADRSDRPRLPGTARALRAGLASISGLLRLPSACSLHEIRPLSFVLSPCLIVPDAECAPPIASESIAPQPTVGERHCRANCRDQTRVIGDAA